VYVTAIVLCAAGLGFSTATGAQPHSSWADPQVVIGIGGTLTGLVVAVTGFVRTFRPDPSEQQKRKGRR
jgi:hypothetical protein